MRNAISALCVLTALGVAAAAQTTPAKRGQGQTMPADRAQQQRSQTNDKVTVTGCLVANGSPDEFVLANAMTNGKQQTAPAQQNRTGQMAGSSEETSAYALEGSANLRAHVGSKVEVTGTLEDKSGSMSQRTAPSATHGTAAAGQTGQTAGQGQPDRSQPTGQGQRAGLGHPTEERQQAGQSQRTGQTATVAENIDTAGTIRVTDIRVVAPACS